MKYLIILSISVLLISSNFNSLFAQNEIKQYEPYYHLLSADKSPYAIPLGYSADIAIDLNFANAHFNPQEIHDQYVNQWDSNIDLSQLDPLIDVEFYNPNIANTQVPIQPTVSQYQTLEFHSYKEGVASDYIFKFHLKDQNGKLYIAKLSNYNFQEIIRAEILKNMGYSIPQKIAIDKLKVAFESQEELNNFITEIKFYLGQENHKSWLDGKAGNTLNLKDVLLEEITDGLKTDLSVSPKYFSETKDKRIFRALVAPFAITHMNSTSINMLKWDAARIESANLILDNPETFKFNASLDDLKWGIRKLSQLSRAHWQSILAKTHLPQCVQALLTEKYLSRVKSLAQLLSIESSMEPIQPTLKCNNEVIDGKLLVDKYPSHPSSFAFGNVKNPLSQEEMASLLWSRVYQFGYSAMVGVFNSIPYLSTDVDSINEQKVNDLINDAVERSKVSGKNENIAKDTWSAPFYNAGLIFDRQIVAGNFLGTTNSVSKAETLGFRVGGGILQGIAGVLPDFNKNGEFNIIRLPFAQAGLEAGVTMTISHIEPVLSVKDAFNGFKLNPFKKANLIKEKNKLAKILKPVFTNEEIDKEAIDIFLENFLINESIIINMQADLGGRIGGRVTTSFFQLDLGFKTDTATILRTHVTRVGPNTIHIYKNNGSFINPAFMAKGSYYLPILRYQIEQINGMANTEFFSINIDKDNPKLKENVAALYDILKKGRFKKIYDLQTPYDLKFKFLEKSQQVGLLMLSHNKLKQNLSVEITNPEKITRKYIRTGSSLIKGVNYYDYALDSADSLIYLFTNWNPPLANNYTYRPSNQIGGEAFVRSTTYEAEIINEAASQPTIKLQRFYSGFKNKSKKVKNKLNKIFNHYHHNFFTDNALNGVDHLFLYQLEVEFNLYPEAIESILNYPEDKLNELFRLNHNHVKPSEALSKKTSTNTPGLTRFLKLRKKVVNNKNNYSKSYNFDLVQLVNHLDENLTLSGLIQIYGGLENFYISPKIVGYRSGIEFESTVSSDRSIFGNTLGIVRDFNLGPLSSNMIRSAEYPGIVEGELFLQWLMRRP